MKRIEKVYNHLFDVWRHSDEKEILEQQGSSATELAKGLGLTRSNVSLELNRLVRAGKVLKVKTFPVHYIPVEIVQERLAIQKFAYFETPNLSQLVRSQDKKATSTDDSKSDKSASSPQFQEKQQKNPLLQMIGYKGSLRKATSQAEAAIMYPPHGLHMMLLGQTGTGKTYFANKIYEYARYKKILKKDAPLISFNCADYYNNPQLLLSTLFGHAKGAYTGAAEDEEGLVEQADNGVLLLDEVHRLPPEGQEMLFYFIDNGTFNRLGENQKRRKANVLIICATTEDPNSSMLKTFLRRIPMTISIPALEERPLSERVELAKFLFQREAERIKKNLNVKIDVFIALLTEVNYGNVGQLKSQVQLTCAQAFLNNINSQDEVSVQLRDLPEGLRQVWLSNSASERRRTDISEYLDTNTIFYVDKTLQADEKDNIYELIENKVKALAAEGVPESDIQQYIMVDMHLHIKNFFKQNVSDDNLAKFVDSRIPQFVEHLKEIAEEQLHCQFDRRFVYYLSMHIDAFFKRGNKTDLLMKNEVKKIKNTHEQEYHVAQIFQKKIGETFDIMMPDMEVLYLTMLLTSIKSMSEGKKVGILVAAHGNATASSMVKVATDLLGDANVAALDMPLTVSPSEILDSLAKLTKKLDQGKGVLLLVDMGSLAMFSHKLEKITGVQLRTVPNVTTSLVLDAVRKVNYLDMDLGTIYVSLKRDIAQMVGRMAADTTGQKKAIVSICMTGSGTAKKLEQIINEIVSKTTQEEIKIFTISALKMAVEIPQIANDYEIIAAVGTKQPSIAIPYISLEDLIAGNGEQRLIALLDSNIKLPEAVIDKNIVVSNMCEDVLRTHLVYLNPFLVCQMLVNWINKLQNKLQKDFSNSRQIKCIVHTAFALERVLRKNEVKYTEEPSPEVKETLPLVEETLHTSIGSLKIKVSEDELYFITETVLN
ncbi:NtrC family transcriptional regulator, ATPase domain [Liquorilactobacillus sucicola DSM 21376 = JCM 15457]|uniref:Ntrc family transcriptional regulator n=1 Tax=Liquorilactobacillus sucicola DSM 21376 = JCM 15457 TaxID=1423806 RepID=A0A023CYH4_9LACO|nr:sigma-54-dependent transcriptional regulator [Liquorilactobacillus sucicola]KRN07137.1 ntrc family transcriptional regulator [Liquorilactobacillus sucicola DSM 21376 = JCM 15457]GAJ26636.1 NtrC family transcriptional regulator, ATPase domain [Liquorilactobacillus sucicola DSM 21376 = JCM 15457]